MKSLAKTDKIREMLPEVELDNVEVFEATAINTNPLRKRHPLYNKAVPSPALLVEMADAVRQESIPLRVMHDSEVLPVGRVFHASLTSGNELRTLFFIDKQYEEQVNLVQNGTVDQVSVGMTPKHIVCSECGHDFRSKETTWENILTGTCANGHKMGEDAHALLTGLDRWHELSLVDTGGVQGARIHSPRTSLLLSDNPYGIFYLQAVMEKNTMDIDSILELKALIQANADKFDALEAKLNELAEREVLVAEALKAINAASDKIDLFTMNLARVLTNETEVPKDQKELAELIGRAMVRLQRQEKQAGPVSEPAVSDALRFTYTPSLASFRSRS